jgi:tetratricopeptide (TPR) repeat protein
MKVAFFYILSFILFYAPLGTSESYANDPAELESPPAKRRHTSKAEGLTLTSMPLEILVHILNFVDQNTLAYCAQVNKHTFDAARIAQHSRDLALNVSHPFEGIKKMNRNLRYHLGERALVSHSRQLIISFNNLMTFEFKHRTSKASAANVSPLDQINVDTWRLLLQHFQLTFCGIDQVSQKGINNLTHFLDNNGQLHELEINFPDDYSNFDQDFSCFTSACIFARDRNIKKLHLNNVPLTEDQLLTLIGQTAFIEDLSISSCFPHEEGYFQSLISITTPIKRLTLKVPSLSTERLNAIFKLCPLLEEFNLSSLFPIDFFPPSYFENLLPTQLKRLTLVNYEVTEEHIGKIIKFAPLLEASSFIRLHIQLAMKHYRDKQWPKAGKAFDIAIRKDKDSNILSMDEYVSAAQVYMVLEQWHEAGNAFDIAFQKDHDSKVLGVNTYMYAGQVYMRLGQETKAGNAYDIALEKDKKERILGATYYAVVGKAYWQRGQLAKAKEAYDIALQKDTNRHFLDPALYVDAGHFYSFIKQWAQAVKAFSFPLWKDQHIKNLSINTYTAAGDAYSHMGEEAKAEWAYEIAREKQ